MLKIGFFGAGKMAQALAKGFIGAGLTKAELIVASCLPNDIGSIKAFQEIGSQTVFENRTVADNSDLLILAVKPQAAPAVLSDLKDSSKKLTLSIAMGVSLQTLEKGLPQDTPVIRVMPNTPSLVGCGATVFARGSKADDEDAALASRLFSSVGICEEVPEAMIDPVTALAGSGPAYRLNFAVACDVTQYLIHPVLPSDGAADNYGQQNNMPAKVYVMIEALADGGVKMGLPRPLAYKLAAQTVLGAGKMVLDTEQHPGQLKDDVASPAGSTITALHYLEKHAFRSALIGAVEAATIRCREVTAIAGK